MTASSNEFVRDAFRNLTDGMTQTVQTGLKFQEESLRFWTEIAQDNFESVRSEWEKMQERMGEVGTSAGERFRKLAEQHTQRGVETLRKGVDFTPTTDPAEMFDRMFATWRSTADVVREATEAFTAAHVDTAKQFVEAMPKVENLTAAATQTTRRATGKARGK